MRKIKAPFVKAMDLFVGRARAFRENEHRIAVLHLLLQELCDPIVAHRDRVELAKPHDRPVKGVVPHPIRRKDDDARMEHEDERKVDVGLVIAQDNRRLFPPLPGFIDDPLADMERKIDDEAANPHQKPMVKELALLVPFKGRDQKDHPDERHQKATQEKDHEDQERDEEIEEGHRGMPFPLAAEDHPIEEEGLKGESDQDHRKDPDHGHDGDGAKGGMLGEDQDPETDDGRDRGEQDRGLVRGDAFLPVFEVLKVTAGDEDAVVDPEAEDEGADHDVEDVEVNPEKPHYADGPKPTQAHGDESDQGQLQPSEGDQQDEGHDRQGKVEQAGEVLLEQFHELRGQVLLIEDADPFFSFDRLKDLLGPRIRSHF